MDFIKAWCVHSGSLDMIAASEFKKPGDHHAFYSKASSWCPDFSTPSLSSSLVRREKFRLAQTSVLDDIDGRAYCADGNVRQEPGDSKYFEFEGITLHCMGVILDKVDCVVASKNRIPFGRRRSLWTHWILQRLLREEQHHQVQRCRTGGGSDGTRRLRCIVAERDERPEMLQDEDPDTAVHGKRPKWCALSCATGTFVSEKGYLSLIPNLVSEVEGDGHSRGALHLAILPTCSVPVLLGDHPEIEGAYRFLGTCFVQGWMEGEVLTEEMGCDDPAEFWEAMTGAEKLGIV
ncbi:uncharacterized protein Z519_00762 [Cladophialophora bantiana CBS 173.52]|uniref:Heterokaryon incompatibility domain-containing protein n=1 Tax=Cladophialophora bantiana (strain ATCC 10958 / CBS 173.52 / CDC B-1940 / NIH 8579) TaxID=1442370 RepID=A0A0D2IQV3_CLAB1|nr:uncharacterized protein Z519_00762 [Cladophialophora bantiana CBS 173.52]KIW99099.1 hypothetical protein Z519_00762 [Cladophialophora bantiana CBS 173.52]